MRHRDNTERHGAAEKARTAGSAALYTKKRKIQYFMPERPALRFVDNENRSCYNNKIAGILCLLLVISRFFGRIQEKKAVLKEGKG
jgi:hypothetical protein